MPLGSTDDPSLRMCHKWKWKVYLLMEGIFSSFSKDVTVTEFIYFAFTRVLGQVIVIVGDWFKSLIFIQENTRTNTRYKRR